MKRTLFSVLLFSLLCVFASKTFSALAPQGGAIATAHPTATRIGVEILNAGGNAFDAAVAVSATLAVVEPYSSGLGGGGFWLLHRQQDGLQVMVDGRERAPLGAHRDMYLDKKGDVVPGLSIDGVLSAAIPGEPAGLAHIAYKYGRLPLAQSLAPAIRAANEGFEVTAHYQRMAHLRLEALRKSPDAASIFLKDNEVPSLGYVIRQPDLAKTLESLGREGKNGFYGSKVGRQLVQGVLKAGGIWQGIDLYSYHVIERKPIKFNYKGHSIVTAPPPSSGGVALNTMFNILDGYKLAKLNPARRTHLIVEAMRRAYRDRALYLGDPDAVSVPVIKLTSKTYAKKLRKGINPDKATPSSKLKGIKKVDSGYHTTHFSILDEEGNRVAATLSINYPFGSGFVVPGTGVLLNDEMDDFSSKPGTPNAYGLVGAEANAIGPGKRMLSSMSPTFVESKDRLAILGTPGGSRIISMVLHAIVKFIEGGGAKDLVSLPRYHHQYLPDVIQYEKTAFNDDMRKALQRMGHQLELVDGDYGNMHVVILNKRNGELTAASDPRGEGSALVSKLK